MAAIPLERTVHYPETDGKPMAETQAHAQVILDLLHTLTTRYVDVPDVYVWGDMCFYYAEGDPEKYVAPDVFLVHGIDKRVRRIYKLWEEGPAPSLVVEVTSKSTRNEDLKIKKALYERLGVVEYFLFDPFGEYLDPRLQGFVRIGRKFRPLTPGGDGALASRTTGLDFIPEGQRLRLRDTASGEPLPWADEEAAARVAAQTESQKQARRADIEARKAEQQAQRADQEAKKAEQLAEQVRVMAEELARLRKSAGA